jgi:hypothetical protein
MLFTAMRVTRLVVPRTRRRAALRPADRQRRSAVGCTDGTGRAHGRHDAGEVTQPHKQTARQEGRAAMLWV